MFEDLFALTQSRTGAQVTDASVVYLHYGVVHGIDYVIGQYTARSIIPDNPRLEVGFTNDFLGREIQELSELGILVTSEHERLEMQPLMEAVAADRDVEIDPVEQLRLSAVISAAALGVLFGAAEVSPYTASITPIDLLASCGRIFRNKRWFLC